MQSQLTLVGIKKNDFNGKIDGEQITSDSTSFFIMQELPASNGKAFGSATQEFKFGKASEFDKWSKIPLPALVDADLNIETNGKNVSKLVLEGIKPSAVQPNRKAA